jgi:hypothetical protein
MAALKRWNLAALDKARAYEIATELTKLCSCYYPYLLPELQRVLERLQPIRLSPCGRKLRAWGRDYFFEPGEVNSVRHLVEQYLFGTRVVPLPLDAFADHPMLLDGILCTDDRGMFWLEEPEDEKNKPPLVIFPDPEKQRPEYQVSKEAMALAALADHPEWSDDQIAEFAGCNRSSLFRMPRYRYAREILVESRREHVQRSQRSYIQ